VREAKGWTQGEEKKGGEWVGHKSGNANTMSKASVSHWGNCYRGDGPQERTKLKVRKAAKTRSREKRVEGGTDIYVGNRMLTEVDKRQRKKKRRSANCQSTRETMEASGSHKMRKPESGQAWQGPDREEKEGV